MSEQLRPQVVEALMDALLEHDFSKLAAVDIATDAERKAALDGIGQVFLHREAAGEGAKTVRLWNLLSDVADAGDTWDELWAKLTPEVRRELFDLLDVLPPELEVRVRAWVRGSTQ